MKRLFVLICFLFLCLPVFAEYKPIPAHLSKQYKAEIESIIDNGYPKAIKAVDDFVSEAAVYHDNVLKNGYYSNNQMDAINLNLLYENCLPAAELDLYADMMKVTQEKYLGVKHEPIGTDWVTPYEDFMTPYLKDNKVDTRKLDAIILYESHRTRLVKEYLDDVEKRRP